MKFLTSIAVRTSCELNIESLCNDAEITALTAKAWLSILVNTKIIFLLPAFSTNKIKRINKTPKIYFIDTGLACYLAGYKDSITLEKSAFNGAIFETYVIVEIIKSFTNNGLNPSQYLTYYRDKLKREIDLLIEYNNIIYPIEIKKNVNPSNDVNEKIKLTKKWKMLFTTIG